ncbi:hypothetical protein LTSEBAI_4939 [Salmonella enterica subsp. enterica serovar Baildon str. R6-199]|nr:hypothetical protein LTSEBAI_4939 [Salmonella enterica subsp. enterica serovar Baildon str. R6-199]
MALCHYAIAFDVGNGIMPLPLMSGVLLLHYHWKPAPMAAE